MHVGHTAIFQNPNNDKGVSDYQIYQEDMAIAKEAAEYRRVGELGAAQGCAATCTA